MARGANLICKVNCPDNMSEIYDITAKFFVNCMYEEMDKNNLNSETKKELISELINKLKNDEIK